MPRQVVKKRFICLTCGQRGLFDGLFCELCQKRLAVEIKRHMEWKLKK